MGGKHSVESPLQSMISNFRKGFAKNCNLKLSPEKLITLCEKDWPRYGARWPPQGTFDLETID